MPLSTDRGHVLLFSALPQTGVKYYAFFSDFNAASYSILVIININIIIRLLFCLLLPCDGE